MTISRQYRKALGSASILVFLAIGGCATPPSDPEDRADFEALNDPLEPTNRTIYEVNEKIDSWAIRPAAVAYRDTIPETGRKAIHNMLANLQAPFILANDSLQGEPNLAAQTLCRFVVNSTLGIGGMIDVAGTYMGLPAHEADFGQTLGIWGVPEGPYLELPIFRSSTVRDTVGLGVRTFLDPVGFAFHMIQAGNAVYARSLVEGVDTRSQFIDYLDDVHRTSLDPYATLRSVYRQHREDMIENPGRAGGM